MSFKKLLLVAVMFLALSPCANAITIGGNDFTKILSFNTSRDMGYWVGTKKYFTFNGTDNTGMVPINVSNVTSKDTTIFGNKAITKVAAMGTTVGLDGSALSSAILNLYGANNELLISATLLSNGVLNATRKAGYAGELDVNAVYQVTGGSLSQAGLLNGPLYIEISFDHIWQNKYKDLYANVGSFTFYQQVCAPGGCGGTTGGGSTGGTTGTQIPEPATVTLLGTSLLGLLRKKSKK